jgi:outer membrane receptor protein involved in Fe transport
VRRPGRGRTARGAALGALLLALLGPGAARAGTTGKIAGRILDQEKKPVESAVVRVIGQRLGGFSDADGAYHILNVPPGTYEVSFTCLGYEETKVREVRVSADETAKVDVTLTGTAIAMQPVLVSAERAQVDVHLTSTKASLSGREIQKLPVQEIQDVVNLQAGVVDGHIRGGREKEVQYQVDGVSINNPYDNSSSIKIDRSLLREVQVISGTFDAEYGQAMSGVVNAVLKSGTETFEWSGEAYGGGYVYEGGPRRHLDGTLRPADARNFQATASGPLGAGTVFLVSGRRYVLNDAFYGIRRFVPTDSSDFERKIFHPTGDGEKVPLGYNREWSGLLKLTNQARENTRLNYQALLRFSEGKRASYAWRLNPDGMTKQRNESIVHGIDWTETFTPSTFLDGAVRQNYVWYRDLAHDDVFSTAYDDAGVPISDDAYALGTIVQGVDFTRFQQKTNAFLVKGTLVSQVNARHQVKMGAEVQFPAVKFGQPGALVFTTVDGRLQLVRKIDEPPDYPDETYHPVIGGAFVQDLVEWEDLTLRMGLRMDYFDARARIPSDLANPAGTFVDYPPDIPEHRKWRLERTSRKAALAPRVGVAYPITSRAGVHFAYGHFYQYPGLNEIFKNANYAALADLQASSRNFDVMGNPDVRAEKTISYEFGYKQELNDRFSFEANFFYKDIRRLLGIEIISTYNDAEYTRLTNGDYGNVVGLTLKLGQRNIGPVTSSLDYTWQRARGQASEPRETNTRASNGEDARPRLFPLNWDQRHTLNLVTTLSRPGAYTVSAIVKAASGQPYTPILDVAFGAGLEENSGRKPGAFLVDLRSEWHLPAAGPHVKLFGRVLNVLDTRFFNGAVYADTGSPFYSRFPSKELTNLLDPTRYYAPRRVEIGIRLGSTED